MLAVVGIIYKILLSSNSKKLTLIATKISKYTENQLQ